MASATGTFGGSYSGISIVLSTSEASVNTANNTSSISWSAYLYFTGSFRPYDFSGSSYWSGSIGGTSLGTNYYNYDFRGFTAGQTIGLGSGSVTYTHASNGTGTASLSISSVAASPLGSSSTGTGSQTTTDISRPPQAPAAPSITRTGTGTTITISSAVAAAATGSPAPPAITNYKYRYSTNNSTWTEVTGMGTDRVDTFGPTSPITVSPTQVYYFQTAATNSEGYGGWSASKAAYAAPSITSVTKNGTSATVTVAPASSNGGSAITSHVVEYSTDQSTWVGGQSISGASGGSTTFTNLPAGRTYYFRAYAINAIPTNSPYQYDLSAGGTASIFISAYGKRYQTVSITGATSGASTVFTSNGHGFSANDPVVITGVDPTSFNISGTISSVTTNTFTVGTASTGTYSTGGTAGGWATVLLGKRYVADDGSGSPGWINITSSQKYTAGAWTSFS